MKTLLVRMDRLGDLIVTLPVDQHPAFEKAEIIWAVPKGLGWVLENGNPARQFREFPCGPEGKPLFCEFLSKEKFDQVVVFNGPSWVGWSLRGIPRRVGVLSKWWSFLNFNRGVRQRRSQAIQHELDYNIELVSKAFKIPWTERPFYQMTKPPRTGLLERHGLKDWEYVVVHPGMGGSARNWSYARFADFIHLCEKSGRRVVVTGTKGDRSWVDGVRAELANQADPLWLNEKLSGPELVEIISYSRGLVVPSTGTAHVAAALGVRVVGLYSPVPVQRAVRWGPLGKEVKVLEPDVKCPGHFKCLMKNCPLFDCMDLITEDKVLKALEAPLEGV